MSQSAEKQESPKLIDALTGARFLAALAVILVHSAILGLRDKPCGFEQMANNAVAFFFVLSGFILTYVYSDKLTWRTIPSYYWARWARIWPLHLVCLLAAVAVLSAQGRIVYVQKTYWQLLAHFSLMQSWLPVEHWWSRFNGPAWSISTELGFYLAFPFFLLMGKTRFWPIVLVAVVITLAFIGYLNFRGNQDAGFEVLAYSLSAVHPLSRMLDFVVGMWVGKRFLHSKPSDHRSQIGFDTLLECAALGFVVCMYFAISTNGLIFQTLAANEYRLIADWLYKGAFMIPAFAALIWVLARSKGVLAIVLSQPLMVWLGEISFAFYMIQYIVIAAIYPFTRLLDLDVGMVMVIVIGASLGLAALLHAVVEVPCRTALRRFVSAGFKQGLQAFATIPTHLVKSGVGLFALSLTAASWGLFTYEINTRLLELRKTVGTLELELADSGFQRVTFADEAILLAYKYEVDAEKLRIDLYWQSLESSRRQRFIHISDAQGKLIRQLNPKSLLNVSIELFARDQIEIKLADLPVNGTVGVGFYSKELRTALADRGTRRMSGRRLELFQWDGAKILSLAER